MEGVGTCDGKGTAVQLGHKYLTPWDTCALFFKTSTSHDHGAVITNDA